jgi:hypothetical protein
MCVNLPPVFAAACGSETDGCEFQEREGVAVEIFPILGEAATTVKSTIQRLGNRTNPLAWSHCEPCFIVLAQEGFFGPRKPQ